MDRVNSPASQQQSQVDATPVVGKRERSIEYEAKHRSKTGSIATNVKTSRHEAHRSTVKRSNSNSQKGNIVSQSSRSKHRPSVDDNEEVILQATVHFKKNALKMAKPKQAQMDVSFDSKAASVSETSNQQYVVSKRRSAGCDDAEQVGESYTAKMARRRERQLRQSGGNGDQSKNSVKTVKQDVVPESEQKQGIVDQIMTTLGLQKRSTENSVLLDNESEEERRLKEATLKLKAQRGQREGDLNKTLSQKKKILSNITSETMSVQFKHSNSDIERILRISERSNQRVQFDPTSESQSQNSRETDSIPKASMQPIPSPKLRSEPSQMTDLGSYMPQPIYLANRREKLLEIEQQLSGVRVEEISQGTQPNFKSSFKKTRKHSPKEHQMVDHAYQRDQKHEEASVTNRRRKTVSHSSPNSSFRAKKKAIDVDCRASVNTQWEKAKLLQLTKTDSGPFNPGNMEKRPKVSIRQLNRSPKACQSVSGEPGTSSFSTFAFVQRFDKDLDVLNDICEEPEQDFFRENGYQNPILNSPDFGKTFQVQSKMRETNEDISNPRQGLKSQKNPRLHSNVTGSPNKHKSASGDIWGAYMNQQENTEWTYTYYSETNEEDRADVPSPRRQGTINDYDPSTYTLSRKRKSKSRSKISEKDTKQRSVQKKPILSVKEPSVSSKKKSVSDYTEISQLGVSSSVHRQNNMIPILNATPAFQLTEDSEPEGNELEQTSQNFEEADHFSRQPRSEDFEPSEHSPTNAEIGLQVDEEFANARERELQELANREREEAEARSMKIQEELDAAKKAAQEALEEAERQRMEAEEKATQELLKQQAALQAAKEAERKRELERERLQKEAEEREAELEAARQAAQSATEEIEAKRKEAEELAAKQKEQLEAAIREAALKHEEHKRASLLQEAAAAKAKADLEAAQAESLMLKGEAERQKQEAEKAAALKQTELEAARQAVEDAAREKEKARQRAAEEAERLARERALTRVSQLGEMSLNVTYKSPVRQEPLKTEPLTNEQVKTERSLQQTDAIVDPYFNLATFMQKHKDLDEVVREDELKKMYPDSGNEFLSPRRIKKKKRTHASTGSLRPLSLSNEPKAIWKPTGVFLENYNNKRSSPRPPTYLGQYEVVNKTSGSKPAAKLVTKPILGMSERFHKPRRPRCECCPVIWSEALVSSDMKKPPSKSPSKSPHGSGGNKSMSPHADRISSGKKVKMLARLTRYVEEGVVDVDRAFRLVQRICGEHPTHWKQPNALTRQERWNDVYSFCNRNPGILAQILPQRKEILLRNSSDKKGSQSKLGMSASVSQAKISSGLQIDDSRRNLMDVVQMRSNELYSQHIAGYETQNNRPANVGIYEQAHTDQSYQTFQPNQPVPRSMLGSHSNSFEETRQSQYPQVSVTDLKTGPLDLLLSRRAIREQQLRQSYDPQSHRIKAGNFSLHAGSSRQSHSNLSTSRAGRPIHTNVLSTQNRHSQGLFLPTKAATTQPQTSEFTQRLSRFKQPNPFTSQLLPAIPSQYEAPTAEMMMSKTFSNIFEAPPSSSSGVSTEKLKSLLVQIHQEEEKLKHHEKQLKEEKSKVVNLRDSWDKSLQRKQKRKEIKEALRKIQDRRQNLDRERREVSNEYYKLLDTRKTHKNIGVLQKSQTVSDAQNRETFLVSNTDRLAKEINLHHVPSQTQNEFTRQSPRSSHNFELSNPPASAPNDGKHMGSRKQLVQETYTEAESRGSSGSQFNDWINSALFKHIWNKRKTKDYGKFNSRGSPQYFTEEEFKLLQDQLRVSLNVAPNLLVAKCLTTLKKLLRDLNISSQYSRFEQQYSLEAQGSEHTSHQKLVDVMSDLKYFFEARSILAQTLKNIIDHESLVQEARTISQSLIRQRNELTNTKGQEHQSRLKEISVMLLPPLTKTCIDNVLKCRDEYHLFTEQERKGALMLRGKDATETVKRELHGIQQLFDQMNDIVAIGNFVSEDEYRD